MIRPKVKKAAPRLIRQINRASILEIIRNEGPISRAELARKTKFSKVTVSSVIRNILAENLIREESGHTSSRGVKPVFYSLNKEDHFFGAISIDANQSTVAITNIESKIIAREDFPTLSGNIEDFLNLCIDHLDKLKSKINIQKLVGVGIGIPGTLDFQREVLIYSINLKWHKVPLLKILKKRIKEPVIIENDTRCAALAEWSFSPNPAIRDADVFIFIKSGIACNLKMNDHLHIGKHNLAGEFGHIIINTIDDSGEIIPPKYLEDFITDEATIDYYHQLANETNSNNINQEMEWIYRRAQNQQPAAIQTVQRMIEYLAIGIANLINLLDPNGIIIYGKITKIWDLVREDLMNNVLKYTLHRDEKNFSIYPSSLNDDTTIIGAATLIIRDFFMHPSI